MSRHFPRGGRSIDPTRPSPTGSQLPGHRPASHRRPTAAHRRRSLPRLASGAAVPGAVVVALVTAGLVAASGLGATTSGADPASYTGVRDAADGFARTVSHGFARADVGGSYARGPVQYLSVRSGRGHIADIRPGQTISADLTGVRSVDQQLGLEVSVPAVPTAGNGTFVSAQLRFQANGDGYRARLRFGRDGILRLSFSKVRGGRETVLGGEFAVPGRVKAGQHVVLQGRVTGTSPAYLAARAWIAGQATPAWQYQIVDSSPTRIATPGSVGIAVYQSGDSSIGAVDVYQLLGWRLVLAGRTRPSSPPTRVPSSSPAPPTTPGTSSPPTSGTTTPPGSGPGSSSGSSSTPPAGSGGSMGAAPVGSMRYAVPAGAVYVALNGSDATGTGTLDQPYATLAKALSKAVAGSTIVLRAGHYNQSALVTRAVTIENYPGEAAWLDGSIPVSGWVRTGAGWVHSGWSYQFDSSASFTSGSNAGNFVNAQYPMAAHPDQVFVDGAQLQQVAAGVSPGAGQFAVDYGAQTITVGSDPTGHAMRASNLQQALVVAAGGVTIRGIGITAYATSLPQIATVYLGGSAGGDTISNVVISDNATQGLSVDTSNTTVEDVTVSANGMAGIHANHAGGLVVQRALVVGNNTQHFNASPSAGGIKVTRTTGVTIRDSQVTDNLNVAGIWVDENVTDFVIVNNQVGHNGAGCAQIQAELSGSGIVAGNVVLDGKYGLTLFDSGNVKVYNNSFRGNAVWDVGLSQDNRYLPGQNTAGASVLPSASNPWLVQNIDVVNNDFSGSTASYEFYALDKQTNRPADSMNITIAGNLFLDRAGTYGSWPIAWGGSDNHTITTYASPQAFTSAKGESWPNGSISGGRLVAPAAVSQDGVPSYAQPLPADVAGATGQAVGTRHVGVF